MSARWRPPPDSSVHLIIDSNKLSFYDNLLLMIRDSYGRCARIHLPLYVRCLCLLIMAMLIVSTGVEMFIIVRDWLQGVAYRDIVASYREYYPELLAYAIPQQRWALFATLVIDMLGYLPYYSARCCAAPGCLSILPRQRVASQQYGAVADHWHLADRRCVVPVVSRSAAGNGIDRR